MMMKNVDYDYSPLIVVVADRLIGKDYESVKGCLPGCKKSESKVVSVFFATGVPI